MDPAFRFQQGAENHLPFSVVTRRETGQVCASPSMSRHYGAVTVIPRRASLPERRCPLSLLIQDRAAGKRPHQERRWLFALILLRTLLLVLLAAPMIRPLNIQIGPTPRIVGTTRVAAFHESPIPTGSSASRVGGLLLFYSKP